MPKDHDKSISDFIINLENSAKKVLKDANNKAKEASRIERSRALLGLKKTKKDDGNSTKFSKTGTVWMNGNSVLDNEKILAGTQVMKYSVPRMSISMAGETFDLQKEVDMDGRQATSTLQSQSRYLSPIKSLSKSGSIDIVPDGKVISSLRPKSGVASVKRSQVLDKLESSPFLSKNSTLDDLLTTMKGKGVDTLSKQADSKPSVESSWALKTHAADVLGGRTQASANVMFKKLLKKNCEEKSRSNVEAQGPIDWSWTGLKCKYRGETQREEAWQSWHSAKTLSSHALDNEVIVPVAKVERHPLFRCYHDFLKKANNSSYIRTKKRLLMKRFVLDVQEVWLTNLQHLREHQPARLLEDPMNSTRSLQSGRSDHSDTIDDQDVDEGRGNGLQGRRDVHAIMAMESQIQSVSQTRSLKRAYYTTRQAEPKVVLDYVPTITPHLAPPPPLPPVIEALVEGLIFRSATDGRMDTCNCQHHDADSVLYMDRLLPAVDSKTTPQNYGLEIFWRLAVIRPHNTEAHAVLVRETAIADIAAAALSMPSTYHSQLVVYETTNFAISWVSREMIVDVVITVSERVCQLPSGDFSLIEIEVLVKLTGENQGTELFLLTSPTEVKQLLHMPKAPFGDINWWQYSSNTEIVWPSLIARLRFTIPSEDSNHESSLHPTDVYFMRPASPGDRVEGALSTSQALSCAHELLPLLRVHADNTIRVAGHEGQRLLIAATGDAKNWVRNVSSPTQAETQESEAAISAGGRVYPHSAIVTRWETLADEGPCLSLITSDGLQFVAQVPGSCEIGRRGLWFPPHRGSKEYTRASVIYMRNKLTSSSDTVFAMMTLALETTVCFREVIAWDEFAVMPPRCPAEEVNGIIPLLSSIARSVLSEVLLSPIQDRAAKCVMIFASFAVEGLDYPPLDVPKKSPGFARPRPFRNGVGFRMKIEVTLMGIDPVLPTIVFGITKFGALPNTVGVNTRNIWHSSMAVVEHINRPRVPKDYHCIVSNEVSRGANDPNTYHVVLKGHDFFGLSSDTMKEFEESYKEIQERRDVFARQMALDAKIERSEVLLKVKEKEQRHMVQKELQRAIEKKLSKATKSEKGWSRRFHMSTLMEVQGNWERRRDDRNGLMFFRHLVPPSHTRGKPNPEQYLQTCQWEVPATWDGDPLENQSSANDDFASLETTPNFAFKIEDPSLVALGAEAVGEGRGAFDEPPDTWLPGHGDGFHLDEKTPGVRSRNVSKTGRGELAEGFGSGSIKPHGGGGGGGGERATATSVSSSSVSLQRKSSVLADRSLAASVAATIDTRNLEHIAEQLVSSDELMRVIAKRLGLPESQVVPARDLESVFSVDDAPADHRVWSRKGDQQLSAVEANDGFDAPRDNNIDEFHEDEFNSDDDLWSDDEMEAGDVDEDYVGDLPADGFEAAEIKRKKWRDSRTDDVKVPSEVPYLSLINKGLSSKDVDKNEMAMGWRRLPRPDIHADFFEKCLRKQTLGPDSRAANTYPKPLYLLPVSPVDASIYEPESFQVAVGGIFVQDARKDVERAIATLERNIKREEALSKNIPTDDLLLFGEVKGVTSLDEYIHNQYKQDQEQVVDPKTEAIINAITAAKTSNIAEMEDALEENIPIDTADEHGNTLFILAAQQGAKRMCKLLLRRGAKINFQNHSGNTGLHYCFSYHFEPLGHYLISRGADDSILNVDGMTCYEGLSQADLKDAVQLAAEQMMEDAEAAEGVEF